MTAAPELDGTTAVILAGGLGTRLRSVVADRPKVLAPVAGRPFLAYLLEQVRSAGVRRSVLCTGHLADQVQDTFGSSFRGMALDYSVETDPAGTGGALRNALPLLDRAPFLALNGDSYCEVDLRRLWQWHHLRPAHATLVVVPVPDAGRFGRIDLDPHGRVVGFHEKSPRGGPGRVNGGIYVLRPEALSRVPEGRTVSLEREVFPALAQSGLYGFPAEGRFIDIGTPESFAEAERFVRELAMEAA